MPQHVRQPAGISPTYRSHTYTHTHTHTITVSYLPGYTITKTTMANRTHKKTHRCCY